jgi:hypothetical protein
MKRTYSLAAVALSVSLFIYLFYRSKSTVVNELMAFIFSSNVYNQVRQTVSYAIPLSEPVIFSLPGGLWVFCLTILSKDLYLKIRNNRIKVAVLPILFVLGLEFLQLIHFTNGTFDLWDIGFYLAFWGLAYFGLPSRDPQQNVLSPFTLKGFLCLTCFLSVYLAHVNS